jgi:hypothetical protein
MTKLLMTGTACVWLIALSTCHSPRQDPGGPLFDPNYHASSTGFPVHANLPFSWSYVTVQNHNQQTVVLNEAKLIDPSTWLETIRVFAFPTGHAGQLSVNERCSTSYEPCARWLGSWWPPARATSWSSNYRSRGSFTASGVSLSYTIGGQAYEISYHDMIRVCAPYSLTVRCHAQTLSS